jgi:hypothetical protein
VLDWVEEDILTLMPRKVSRETIPPLTVELPQIGSEL